MNTIKQAIDRWALTLDVENLSSSEHELLHLINNTIQAENIRQFNQSRKAVLA